MAQDQAGRLNVSLRRNREGDVLGRLCTIETDGALLGPERGERQAGTPKPVLETLGRDLRVIPEAGIDVIDGIVRRRLLGKRGQGERGGGQYNRKGG
jgi:hypothetical protein